jgi:NAD(P)H-dependent FMN reductase
VNHYDTNNGEFMNNIAIIVGSTREGSLGPQVADWIYHVLKSRTDATFEVVNVGTFRLSLLGESSDMTGIEAWSKKIAAFDGFIFVTAEYNHSITGSLKNALDLLLKEWENKAAGIVSYGYGGGARAAEHLRTILGALHVADIRKHVMVDIASDFVDKGSKLAPRGFQANNVLQLGEELVKWTTALKTIR